MVNSRNSFAAAPIIPSALLPSIALADRDDRLGLRGVPRDAIYPFGHRRTGTPWPSHAACRLSPGNARRRALLPSCVPKRPGPQQRAGAETITDREEVDSAPDRASLSGRR
jgi:hypothetical protein